MNHVILQTSGRPRRRMALLAAAAILAGALAAWPAAGAAAPQPQVSVYTVAPGDTLWRIAARHGTTTAALRQLNPLPYPDRLVPGLHLLVPRPPRTYTVRPGDALWRIAAAHGVSVASLAEANALSNPNRIHAGQVLVIPTPRPEAVVNAYLAPTGWNAADRRRVTEVVASLSWLTVWSAPVRPDGSLGEVQDEAAVEAARGAGLKPVLSVTNFRDGNFQPEPAHGVLANPGLRGRLIDEMVRRVRERGYGGLNIDFENLYPSDRHLFTTFVRETVEAAHASGIPVSVAMVPKAADRPNEPWVGFFDYAALGALVDHAILMTYEWGWIGGRPMAIAPLNQVRAVLEYATRHIPASKILMGVPLYGYDWELPDTPENLARGLSPQQAVALATEKGVPIRWDERAASPWFRYRDARGVEHEVWFEDARSVAAKYALAREFGVGGISFWVLGNEFPQNWALLQQRFRVAR